MENNKIALLFSGGMDSYVAYYYLQKLYPNKTVVPIYIHYGGAYCNKEVIIAKQLLPQTLIIKGEFNLRHLETGEKAFLPNRNLYLITRAAEISPIIFIGGLKDDNVGDKSPKFCVTMSHLLTISKGEIVWVDSPFWMMEKINVVEWFINYAGKDKAIYHLKRTVSCYDPFKQYCGKCPSCFRKACALAYFDVPMEFYNLKLVHKYMDNIDNYTPLRKKSIYKLSNMLAAKNAERLSK